MATDPKDPTEAARISLASLVKLNEAAEGLSLSNERMRTPLAGRFISRLKGRGMVYAESRPYQPGDDARSLHWRVIARTGKAFTKQFHEERDRPVFIWVDLRDRMFFGTRGVYKAIVAVRAAALIAWAASRNGDRIGGVIFSDKSHYEIKPGRSKAAVLYLLRSLVEHSSWDDHANAEDDGTSMREAIIRLRRVARPGSLLFLFSDFSNLDELAEANLKFLARRTEMMLMMISDPFEKELPPPGIYPLTDGEMEVTLDTGSRRYREMHAKRFEERLNKIRDLARNNAMSFLLCKTDEDPVALLRRTLGWRKTA
jgi:uncharacterized protein (DUF58 family)